MSKTYDMLADSLNEIITFWQNICVSAKKLSKHGNLAGILLMGHLVDCLNF